MSSSALVPVSLNVSLFLGSGVLFSISVKRVFFASWRGSAAWIATVLIGICWALAIGQFLGALGWLRSGPLALSALVSAASAVAIRRYLRAGEPASVPLDGSRPGRRDQPALLVATVLLVLLVAAVWTARTVLAVRRGIYDPDSLGYHLPFAATFAQTGYADQTRFIFPGAPIQFFPANDELLAAMSLLLTRSMAFVAIKNLIFGGLILVAAHAVGKVFDAALLAVGAAATVLGLPVVAFSQPGEGVNDSLPALAVLGGVAVLAHGRGRPRSCALALACSGVACGSKFSTVVPGVALAALALWMLCTGESAHRPRTAGAGAFAALAMGGPWYLRNAVTYGNPLPPAHLGIGSFALRKISTEGAADAYSIAWYLVRGRALGQFWHGLGRGLGPLFPLVLVAVLFGVVGGLRSSGFRRGLSVLVIVTGVGYLILPGSAYGGGGSPGAFVINLHYAIPVLLTGLVGAAVVVRRWRWDWILPAAGWLVLASSISPGRRIAFWEPEMGGRGFVLLVAASLIGGLVAALSVRPSLRRWSWVGTAATAALTVVAVVVIGRQHPSRAETDPVQRWAARVAPTRIGGWVPAAALLYGPGARNRVVTLTRDRSVNGGPVALDSCPAWMQALGDGRFPFAGVIPDSQWQRWLDADPAFEPVVESDTATLYRVAVYRVVGRPDPTCTGGT